MSAALATYEHDDAKPVVAPSASMDISKLSPIQVALTLIQNGADFSSVKEMMEFSKGLEADQAKRSFDAAMAMAKSETAPVTKRGKGHNDRKYATFADYAAAIDPILSKHGLSYRFRTEQGSVIKVTCVLSHRDGHAEENSLSGPADTSGSKNAIQALGSTLTYLQRYTLIQALGLAASDDDDGQKHGKSQDELKTISPEQVKIIRDLIEETQTDIEQFCAMGKIEAIPDILASDFSNAERILLTKKAKMAGGNK